MKQAEAVIALGALAHESRLAIFRELVKRGPDGYTPGDLMAKIAIPPATLSFHLKELQRADLVSSVREGRFLYYRTNFVAMQDLIGFLTEKCCSLSEAECGTACKPVAATAKRKRA